ncbi:MAG TPA: hypothetical protein VFG59_14925, partial [Anaeromyxobacter sp.]|nr:hypothetical protein [Anaeromyxobacter sp.]
AAAPAPSLAGYLAAPTRGGTPGGALALMALCSPVAAAVALFLPGRSATRSLPTSAAHPPPAG